MELWKPIINYEGLYEVSNLGRIRGLDRKVIRSDGRSRTIKGTIIKPKPTKDGYLRVQLSKCNRFKWYFVHRLVLTAFSPCDNMDKLIVNHKDFNRQNNAFDNLEWMNHSDNIRYSIDNGRYEDAHKNCTKGEECSRAVYTNEEVLNIRYMYDELKYSMSEIVYKLYGIRRMDNPKEYQKLICRIDHIVKRISYKYI